MCASDMVMAFKYVHQEYTITQLKVEAGSVSNRVYTFLVVFIFAPFFARPIGGIVGRDWITSDRNFAQLYFETEHLSYCSQSSSGDNVD